MNTLPTCLQTRKCPCPSSQLEHAAKYRSRRYPSANPSSYTSWEYQRYLQHGPGLERKRVGGRSGSRCNLQETSAFAIATTHQPNEEEKTITYHTASNTQSPSNSSAGTPPSYPGNAASHAHPPRSPQSRYTFLAQTAAPQVQGYRWGSSYPTA